MSGPERELPPLRVKLIGDGSSYKKMMTDARKDAEDLANVLAKRAKRTGDLDSLVKQAFKHAAARRQELQRRMRALDRAAEREIAAAEQVARAAQRDSESRRRELARRNRALDRAARQEIAGIERVAAAARRAEERRRRDAERTADRIERAMRRAQERNNRGTRNRGGNSLGDRADIYMHRNAIISLADAWSGPIKALSKYQSQIAMMTSFVGEGPAKKFIDDLRQSQVGRLYGDEASVAATRFLPLTKDAGKTKKILDQVGNIAAGDAERFQGISRALSQVMTQGYLQGDELEQFAERGFPMTELLAKNLKISTAEVRKLGEQRRLSSSLILAVMEKETSAGGDYAGTMGRMSEKLGGVISSVMSLYTELQTKVMEAAEKEITSYVQVLAGYLKQIVEWVRINQEQVRGYVLLAIKITAAVAAFHLLGLAVAYARWMMHSFTVVLIALMAVFRGLRVLVIGTIQILAVLRGTLALTQVGFVATWIAALGPVGAVVAAISLVVGVVSALIISLTSPGGLAGAFKYAFGVASDFFMWIAKQFGFDMEKGFLEAMGVGLDPKFLKDAKVEIPEAPDTDFSSLIGPGKEKGSGARGSNEYKLFDSLSKHSGEYKERRWQQQMTLARWEQGAAAPQDKQDRMIKALDGIEKNTRPAGWQKQLQWIEPANLAGVP